MTTQDLHDRFLVDYDKASTITAYPMFTHAEIDVWLNKAVNAFLNQKFTGNNNRGVSFEQDSKVIADLQNLLRTVDVEDTSTNPVAPNSISFNLTSNFLYPVSAYIKLPSYIGGAIEKILIVDHAAAQNAAQTSINMPWLPQPVGTFEENTFVIYFDPIKYTRSTFGGGQVYYTYISQPRVLDYDNAPNAVFQLTDNAAYEVIQLAVLFALENIESDRVQTKGQTLTLQ